MPFASISLVTNIPTVGSSIRRSPFQIRLALNKDKIYTADHKIRLIQTISSTSVLKSEIKCIKGTDIARWRKQLPSLYSIKPTEWNTKVLSLTFIYLTSSISGKYPPSSTSTGKKTSYKLLVTLNSLESLRECNILTDMTGIQLKAPVLVETDVRRLLQLCRDSINPNWM